MCRGSTHSPPWNADGFGFPVLGYGLPTLVTPHREMHTELSSVQPHPLCRHRLVLTTQQPRSLAQMALALDD